MTDFAEHTTVRVGGSAGEWIAAGTEQEALAVLARHPLPSEEDRAAGRDALLVLGGGSNLLVSDAGFGGTVLQLSLTGITAEPEGPDPRGEAGPGSGPGSAVGSDRAGDRVPRGERREDPDGEGVLLTVAAGHSWDEVVAHTVERGWAGLEALSGIPGSAGATPVQNVGAYGAEVSQTLVDLRAWDRAAGELVTLCAEELEFAYRDSLLKRETIAGSPRYVVLSVRFRLTEVGRSGPSAPVRYGELARSLGMEANAAEDARRAPLQDVRDKVLALRAGKGMVLDPADHDTWSTGSFFTNPIVPASSESVAALPEGAPRFPAGEEEGVGPLLKLSAAWLIDQAGCGKGFGLPEGPEAGRGADGTGLTGGRASLSTKHTLAVTNRGEASAEDLLTVARAARDRVRDRFGITLHPEPVLLGCSL